MLAAVVWTFWMAVAITGLAVIALIATVAGYLAKVVKLKYPPRQADR
jgi:hypothetical protein